MRSHVTLMNGKSFLKNVISIPFPCPNNENEYAIMMHVT